MKITGFVEFNELPRLVIKTHFIVGRMKGSRIATAKIVEAETKDEVAVPKGYEIICDFTSRNEAISLLKYHKAIIEE